MGETPTEPVTILFTDIEGSTRQWETDPVAMEAALRRHDEILRDAIESSGGRVFTTQGDGFGAVFEDARRAAESAKSAQRQLEVEVWPGSIEIRVRMGLHTGMAWARDGDYFGPSINRAARLMASGHGRQILVSDAARATLGANALVDLGEHRLKDLSAPEHIWQLGIEGVEADYPPIRTLDLVATNLPVRLSSFVGREREVEHIAGLLDAQRLVTLTGMGGVGKTRLALQVGADASHQFSDGVWFVELAPVRPGSGVGYQFAEAMGESVDAGSTPLDTIVGAIGDGSVLLLVDNCEHVLDDVRAVLGPLLGQCPNTAAIASSLEPLGIDGEFVYAVSPLAADGVDSPALQLFVERAEAANATFDLSGSRRELIADICAQLDGLPLALELAAARARSMTPEDLAERLGHRFRLLRARADDDRHQTLVTTIDWAYELLTPDEQTLFNRLSIFRGPFPVAAVEQVCCDDRIDDLDAIDLLGRLVDRSMVVADLEGQHAKYRMLESLRHYGRERLGDEVVTWRERSARYHGRWIGQVVDRLRTSDEPEAVRDLDSSWADLRAAVQWALHFHDLELLARILGDLAFEAMFRARREVGEWARSALELVDEAEAEADVSAALLGVASASAADPETTVELGERFLELATTAPERSHPQTLLAVGLSMHLAGDSERPLVLYELAEQSGRARGDDYVECPASSLRSLFYAYTDRPEKAREAALHAIALLDDKASVTTRVGVQICDALRAEDPPAVLQARMEEALVDADSVRCEMISNVAKMVLATVRGSLGELTASQLAAADTLEHQRNQEGGGLVVSQQLRRAAVLMLRAGNHRPALSVLAFLEGHATPQANPGTQRELEELLPKARAGLGGAAVTEAGSQGALLTQTQVIDLAIETLRASAASATS